MSPEMDINNNHSNTDKYKYVIVCQALLLFALVYTLFSVAQTNQPMDIIMRANVSTMNDTY